MQQAESGAIKDLEPPTPEIEEEVAIKAYKKKIQRDLEIFRKLQNARHMTGEKQITELSQVEYNKTSDSLVLEYGFTLVDLLTTV